MQAFLGAALDAQSVPVTVTASEIVAVRVKPGSRKGPLVETGPDGELTIYVRERAVDGKANEAVTKVLADHLGAARSEITLIAGNTARLKRFRVQRRPQ